MFGEGTRLYSGPLIFPMLAVPTLRRRSRNGCRKEVVRGRGRRRGAFGVGTHPVGVNARIGAGPADYPD